MVPQSIGVWLPRTGPEDVVDMILPRAHAVGIVQVLHGPGQIIGCAELPRSYELFKRLTANSARLDMSQQDIVARARPHAQDSGLKALNPRRP